VEDTFHKAECLDLKLVISYNCEMLHRSDSYFLNKSLWERNKAFSTEI